MTGSCDDHVRRVEKRGREWARSEARGATATDGAVVGCARQRRSASRCKRREEQVRQPAILSGRAEGHKPLGRDSSGPGRHRVGDPPAAVKHSAMSGQHRARRRPGSSGPSGHGARVQGPVRQGECGRRRTADRAPRAGYLSSTVAPAASSWALAFSASSLETFSRTALGAPSTRSLASLRPRLVRDADLLDDLDLLVAGGGEDDVELVLLLLGGLGGTAAAGRGRGGHGHRGGGGDAERPRTP